MDQITHRVREPMTCRPCPAYQPHVVRRSCCMFNAALLWIVKKVIVGTLQEALYLWSKYRLLLSPEDSAAFFAVHRLHGRAIRLSPCLSRSWGQILDVAICQFHLPSREGHPTPPPTYNFCLNHWLMWPTWARSNIWQRKGSQSADICWHCKTTVQLWHGLFSLFSLHLCDDAQAVFDSHKTTV